MKATMDLRNMLVPYIYTQVRVVRGKVEVLASSCLLRLGLRMTRVSACCDPCTTQPLRYGCTPCLLAHTLDPRWLQSPQAYEAQFDTQYQFGPDILVSPIVTSSSSPQDKSVFLPPADDWLEMATGLVYSTGNVVTVPPRMNQVWRGWLTRGEGGWVLRHVARVAGD